MGNQFEKWIEARGLDLDTVTRLGVSAARRSADGDFVADLSGDWAAIPYLRNGVAGRTKYRATFNCRDGKKPHAWDAPEGAERYVWNCDVLHDDTLAREPLIITEGEWDAMAAIQAGFPRAVSVPDGHSISAKDRRASMTYLDADWEAFDAAEQILVASDSDAVGDALAADLAVRLGSARLSRVRYPKGCKDLNDALRLFGVEGVRQSIRRAAPIPIEGLYRFTELPEPAPLERWYAGISPVFDARVAICPGMWSVVTGTPGQGKSTIVRSIMFGLAHNHGIRTAWLGFEDQPARARYRRFAASWINRRRFDELSAAQVASAEQWLDDFIFPIVPPDSERVDLAWCLDRCEAAVRRYGCRLVVIDPWTMIGHDYSEGLWVHQEAEALSKIAAFARRFGVHVMIVAHPRKHKEGVPGAYDISGSAHWFNLCYLGLSVGRTDEDADDADIVVWKVKYHGLDEMGFPGKVRLTLDQLTGRWRAPIHDAASFESALDD